MSGTDLDVFVVQVEPTGLWEADCCNILCGQGMHNVAEGLTSQGSAEKAATAHRRHLRKRIAEENGRWERMAASDDPVAREAVLLRERLRAAEAMLGKYRRRFGPPPEGD